MSLFLFTISLPLFLKEKSILHRIMCFISGAKNIESSVFIGKCLGILLSPGRFKLQIGNCIERVERVGYFTFPGLDNEIGGR